MKGALQKPTQTSNKELKEHQMIRALETSIQCQIK